MVRSIPETELVQRVDIGRFCLIGDEAARRAFLKSFALFWGEGRKRNCWTSLRAANWALLRR